MTQVLKCILCGSQQLKVFHQNKKQQNFWKCSGCQLIFLDPACYLGPQELQERYGLHQNNVEDAGYQKFLSPVIEAVIEKQSTQDLGLDFGCGPQSVVVHRLRRQDFQIEEYDPLYFPDLSKLGRTYDYITCTEVAEHFTKPLAEFQNLFKLLRDDGRLYLKTALVDGVRDFPNWHYHRDPTHVSFYSESTLDFLRRMVGFSSLEFREGLVVFEK